MSTVKANQHQVGSNVTPDKNIVFTTDVSTGDLVINKGVFDGTLTEISRIMNAGGGVQYVPAGTGAVATTVQAKLRDIGTGSLEGVLPASVGSLYLRSNGGANTTLYVKESGTGNTGWVAK